MQCACFELRTPLWGPRCLTAHIPLQEAGDDDSAANGVDVEDFDEDEEDDNKANVSAAGQRGNSCPARLRIKPRRVPDKRNEKGLFRLVGCLAHNHEILPKKQKVWHDYTVRRMAYVAQRVKLHLSASVRRKDLRTYGRNSPFRRHTEGRYGHITICVDIDTIACLLAIRLTLPTSLIPGSCARSRVGGADAARRHEGGRHHEAPIRLAQGTHDSSAQRAISYR